MNKAKGLIRLMRPELPFAAGVCAVMGQLLALGKFPPFFIIFPGFFSIFFISASILVLNDYYDAETDKINAPNRPIPSKLVLPSEALTLSIILLLAGLLLSYLVSQLALMCSILLTIVGILYNRKFKKYGFIGNIMVSFSVGMTFVYGAISVDLPFNKIALFFGVIAALIDLGEEIAADSMDVAGDLLIESNSLAIRYGRLFALKISFSIFFLVVLLTFIPFIMKWFSSIYLVPIIFMDFAIAVSSYKLLKSKENKEGRGYIRKLYLGATAGILIFLVMRLANI